MATKNAHNFDTRIKALRDEFERSESFHIEVIKLELTELIYELMEKSDMTKAALAEAINVSRSYITKMLKGDVNFTIETLFKVASALDCMLNVSDLFVPKQRMKTYDWIATNVVKQHSGNTKANEWLPMSNTIVMTNPTDNLSNANRQEQYEYRSAA